MLSFVADMTHVDMAQTDEVLGGEIASHLEVDPHRMDSRVRTAVLDHDDRHAPAGQPTQVLGQISRRRRDDDTVCDTAREQVERPALRLFRLHRHDAERIAA